MEVRRKYHNGCKQELLLFDTYNYWFTSMCNALNFSRYFFHSWHEKRLLQDLVLLSKIQLIFYYACDKVSTFWLRLTSQLLQGSKVSFGCMVLHILGINVKSKAIKIFTNHTAYLNCPHDIGFYSLNLAPRMRKPPIPFAISKNLRK